MAIIKCPDCDAEVETTAKACPNCGKQMVKKQGLGPGGLAVIVLLIAAAIGYWWWMRG